MSAFYIRRKALRFSALQPWILLYKQYDFQDYTAYFFGDTQSTFEKLTQTYGLKFEYEPGPGFLEFGNSSFVANGKVIQVEKLGLARYSRLLPGILSKYPTDLIKSRLKKVKICKTLSFYNFVYGGTYYNDIIYLATHGDYGLFTDDYVARVFHHEFSSVLLQYTPFPIQKWVQANPAGFSYDKTSAGTIEALQEGRDLEVYEKTYQQGLVDPYGATSYENDFNLYAEMVFVEPRKMAELIKKYPTIAKKYHLVKEFYLSIHPGFNKIFKQVF